MDKLRMQTANKADENFRKLAAMFPNAVTETINENGEVVRAIDKDVLMREIACTVVDGNEERYQFTWPDKKKSVLLANAPINKTLRPVREDETVPTGADSEGKPYCSSGSVNFDTTENLYIEGDNLEVLKLLQETYLGKIKMIYIDPPYNTGSDLVYNDDFSKSTTEYIASSGYLDEDGNRLVENLESNGRYHTDWLNMIYSRLRLAKDLLATNGVIFVSLDDNESANLKKICDEVFGAVNFIGQITVVGNPRGRDYGGVARMHDYLFVYKKSPEAVINLIEDSENSFKMFDSLGGFELRELRNRNIKFNKENRPNLYYPFYINPATEDEHGLHEISLEPKDGWIELYPLESQGVNTVWRWGKQKSQENLNVNIKAKPMRNGSYMIVEKYREGRMMARSVWWDKDTNTEKGTLLVKELMEGKVFDYPKTVEMLMKTIEMGTDSDEGAYVLDFFSGSGTTAHAVMQLNAKDGGNRKFIMVQLPERTDEKSEAYKAGYKNICEIGKERIRRAGRKIKEDSPLTTQDLDIGFRVLKCDTSNMKEVYYNPAEYEASLFPRLEDNIKEDRTPEDLLFQVMLDLGVLLSSKIEETTIAGKKVFNVEDNYLIACFDSNVTEETIKAIAKQKPYYFVMRDSSMANDSVATNFDQIFATYSPDTVRKVL
ncbi:adenine specific DNA methylase Mod [Firmicutes bacterium CAG:129]|jgi:adenine-specific DNA-methyltransferase|nr:adenine specific DNA methylase Mod [Firmicutes bacterium CAG:129]